MCLCVLVVACPSVNLTSVELPIYLSVYFFICLCPCIFLSTQLDIFISASNYLPIYLSTYSSSSSSSSHSPDRVLPGGHRADPLYLRLAHSEDDQGEEIALYRDKPKTVPLQGVWIDAGRGEEGGK